MVLNLSFEPITVCSVKKAITLIFLGKAVMLRENEDMPIKTVSGSYPCPAIIKLTRYVRIPYRSVELTRRNILLRDGHKCLYCGATERLTIDHVLPRSRGGENSWENLATACISCNNKKGNRTPSEAEMKLSHAPYRPSHIFSITNSGKHLDERWKPFLFTL